MKTELKPEERLIVAADYDPEEHGGRRGVVQKVRQLARILYGAGVYIKVNSALRAYGYNLIDELRGLGLRVFADLKLCDIPKTMEFDGKMLAEAKPDIVTAMCCAGVRGLHDLQTTLPDTKVLGVTILTSLDEEDCQAIFTCSTKAGVLRFARLAQLAGVSGLILSPKELEVITARRHELSLELSTPGIRPEWALVKDDDQKRVMTPAAAITAGAERIVVGRPITGAEDPAEAVILTLDEIKRGLAARK